MIFLKNRLISLLTVGFLLLVAIVVGVCLAENRANSSATASSSDQQASATTVYLYNQGKGVVLDSKSPYLNRLIATGEEALITSSSGPLQMFLTPVAWKALTDRRVSIKIEYTQPRKLTIAAMGAARTPKTVEVNFLLIPLTGAFAQTEEGTQGITIFGAYAPFANSSTYQVKLRNMIKDMGYTIDYSAQAADSSYP